MLSLQNIFDTIDMIDKQHLDIRTITMGISLLDCVSEDADRCCRKIYDKICRRAEKLVRGTPNALPKHIVPGHALFLRLSAATRWHLPPHTA